MTAESRAAQLALQDAGKEMEGWISTESIHESYFKTRNFPKEMERLYGDEVTAQVVPAAIEDGVVQVLRELGKQNVEKKELIIPPEENGSSGGQADALRRSGQGDPPLREDVGAVLGANEGGAPV